MAIQSRYHATDAAVDYEHELTTRAGLLLMVVLKFRDSSDDPVAPTTSEDVTITHKSAKGSNYDYVLDSQDPSTDSLTQVRYVPDAAIPMTEGDAILVEYDNSDTNSVYITLKFLDSDSF